MSWWNGKERFLPRLAEVLGKAKEINVSLNDGGGRMVDMTGKIGYFNLELNYIADHPELWPKVWFHLPPMTF